MLQKEVEHGMKRATIVKQISLTFLLHFKSSSTFFNIRQITSLIRTSPETFNGSLLMMDF
ncbi:hypothetical protein EQK26_00685 [Lactiplantibacillus plantarum]|nr:hypothetical protein EQK26_00685 [Lactiplantibacillus plantarum]